MVSVVYSVLKREITPLSEGRYLWWGRREGVGGGGCYCWNVLTTVKFYRYFGGSLLLAGRYFSFGICPQPLSLHSEGCYFRFRGRGAGW